MGLRSYQLVLAAAAQRLSNVYGGASANNAINPADDIGYRAIYVQTTGANAFVGGENPPAQQAMGAAVTSTNFGTEIDATDLQPVVFGGYDAGTVKLSDYWVAGAGATLHVTGIPF